MIYLYIMLTFENLVGILLPKFIGAEMKIKN